MPDYRGLPVNLLVRGRRVVVVGAGTRCARSSRCSTSGRTPSTTLKPRGPIDVVVKSWVSGRTTVKTVSLRRAGQGRH